MARQVSSIIYFDRCSCRGSIKGQINKKVKKISNDPPGVKKLSRRQELSRSIHQELRSCRDCNKKKIKKLNRQQGVEEVSSQLFKIVFQEEKNTDMNAIQHTTQTMIQSTQYSLKIVFQSKTFEHKDLQNTHTHTKQV